MDVVYARDLIELEHDPNLVNDAARLADMRAHLAEGDIYLVRQVIPRDLIARIKTYLTNVGRHSLPNYHPLEPGCPNFHRVNQFDPRAYVQTCFHQFSFFPWNQDVFNLFEAMKPVFHVKNQLNNLPKDKFTSMQPEDGCAARLSFQFYPKGGGCIRKHTDPVSHHQLNVSLLTMSKKGEDYTQGGGFVERKNGERILFDDITEPGDVVHSCAATPHGVEDIDPSAPLDWLAFEGRWMMIFSVNQVVAGSGVHDSVDLDQEAAAESAAK